MCLPKDQYQIFGVQIFSVLPEVLSRQVLLHTIQNVVYFYKNTFEYQFEAISLAVERNLAMDNFIFC